MVIAGGVDFVMEQQQQREQAEAAEMDRMRAQREAMEEAMRAERAALEQALRRREEEARLSAERLAQLGQHSVGGLPPPPCD